MRKLAPDLEAHLASATTTLCDCWLLQRRDGVRLGFSDHDRPLNIEGVACLPAAAMRPTEAVSSLGLAPDNQDVEGALSHGSITAEDLDAGLYDGARVEVWRVNWAVPEQRVHLRTQVLGEVTRHADTFRAELRGLTSLLAQARSRAFIRDCDAEFGDARCGVDLSAEALHLDVAVIEVIDGTLLRLDLPADDRARFANGTLEWTGSKRRSRLVALDDRANPIATLWSRSDASVGDTARLVAGCDKAFATCRDSYANAVNFRGFPHMPGEDFALGYADTGSIHDGSVLVK